MVPITETGNIGGEAGFEKGTFIAKHLMSFLKQLKKLIYSVVKYRYYSI